MIIRKMTIEDYDEITMANMSIQEANKISAPMIVECMVNLECELEWEHDLMEENCIGRNCRQINNSNCKYSYEDL